MKKAITATILLLCLTAAAYSQSLMTDWQFYAEVNRPESTQDYFLIPLNGEVYDKAREDFGDLRLIDEAGKDVPIAVYSQERKATKVMQAAGIINKGIKEGEFTTLTVDLGERKGPVNRIELEISSKNFLRQVKVEGSTDLSNWILLNSSRYIFDSSEQTVARSTSIVFDDTTYRYLQVTIFDGGDNPLDIHGSYVGLEQTAKEVEIVLPAVIVRDSSSAIVFDMGHNFPSHGVALETNDKNFHRKVGVYGSKDGENYSSLMQGVIYRYELDGAHDELLTIPYAESFYRFIKLEIHDGNNKPLSITHGSFLSLPRYLLAEAKGIGVYRLYYGGAPQHYSPRYDLEQLIRHINVESKPQAQMTSHSANPGYQPPQKHWSEENQWLLWSILVMAVAFLIALIWKNIKSIT